MLSRSVLLNTIGNAAGLALGFVASVVLARWLGPSDRGLLAVMVSVASVTYIVAAIGLPLSVEYHVSRDRSTSGGVLGNTLLYGAVLAAVVVPVFVLLHGWLADRFGDGRGGAQWILVGALVPVSFVAWTASNQITGVFRFGLFNLLQTLSRVAYVAGVLLLLAVAHLGVLAGLIATGLSAAVLAAGSLVVLLKEGRPRLDRGLLRSMLSYGSRNQLALIFQAVNYRLDVVILSLFRPLREVGYYVVAQVIAELSIALSNAFGSVLPIVSGEELEERKAATATASIRHHGVLAAATLLATAAFGPLLIAFAFGRDFHAAIAPMLLLLPGIWFLGTGTVASANLSGRGRPGLAALFAGVAALVTVTLDLALIPFLAIYGAVLASVAAYTTYGIGTLVALSRVSGIPLRRLAVPTRDDLRLYPAAAGRVLKRA